MRTVYGVCGRFVWKRRAGARGGAFQRLYGCDDAKIPSAGRVWRDRADPWFYAAAHRAAGCGVFAIKLPFWWKIVYNNKISRNKRSMRWDELPLPDYHHCAGGSVSDRGLFVAPAALFAQGGLHHAGKVLLPASPYSAASGISPIPTLSKTIKITRLLSYIVKPPCPIYITIQNQYSQNQLNSYLYFIIIIPLMKGQIAVY